MKLYQSLGITFFVVGLIGCASSVNLPSYDTLLAEQTEQNGRECIRESDIWGYGVLDDHVISIDSRRKNEYFLATTILQCNSLSFGPQAAFVSRFGEFCGGGADKVVTHEEACLVKSLYKFESKEQALAAYNQAKDKRQQIRQDFETAQNNALTKQGAGL